MVCDVKVDEPKLIYVHRVDNLLMQVWIGVGRDYELVAFICCVIDLSC